MKIFPSAALALLLLASAARAEGPASSTESEDRFRRGVKSFEAGKYEAALLEFEAAYAASPQNGLLYNVAVTQRKLGRMGDALKSFERYLKGGGDAIAPERRKLVEKELTELRPFFAEITLTVSGAPASLEVDGAPIGTSPLPDVILLESGVHSFKASRPGDQPAEQKLKVLSGNTYAVALSPRITSAELEIRSKPEGAALTLDGEKRGVSPFKGRLPEGPHDLVLDLEGFARAEQRLLLTGGEQKSVTVELTEIVPLYKRWYLWAGAAVVLGAGGYGVYYVTRPRYDVLLDLR